jgi:hypothetical protein
MNPLENFPPLYYINLDRRPDRNEHMVKLIATYGLDGTRVAAVDGKEPIHSRLDVIPERLRPVEIATTISHLQTIRHWLSHSKSDTAILCEDDVSFDTVSSWGCSWKHIKEQFPPYWDIVQLCIIYHPLHECTISLHHRPTTNFSAACYMINRRYAEKLMSLYWNKETKKWRLHGLAPYPLTAEEAIYRPGACLSIPLFTYTGTMGSDIQSQDHIDQYHAISKNIHQFIWKHNTALSLLPMMPPQQIKLNPQK